MELFDDNDFDEQLWTDAWIEEVDREAGANTAGRDERSEIQDAIDSGLYSKEELIDMFGLDESDLDDFDTFMLDDES